MSQEQSGGGPGMPYLVQDGIPYCEKGNKLLGSNNEGNFTN